MGCCSSSDDTESKPILNLPKSKVDSEKGKKVKLLLLGSGEGGKSTLFMNIQHRCGANVFHSLKKEQTIQVLQSDIVYYMLQLILKVYHFDRTDLDVIECTHYVDDSELGEQSVQNIKEFAELCHQISVRELDTIGRYTVFDADLKSQSPEIVQRLAQLIPELWCLPCVKRAFKFYGCLSGLNIPDHIAYFFPRAMEILNVNYIPSNNDILNCYMRTTGVAQCDYEFNNHHLQIIDVGAQRSERRKWRSLMDGVSAVIYVAALNQYKSVLFEESDTNAMHESINVFSDYINHSAFENSSLFLVLNKLDLFEESIREIPLGVCFSEKSRGWNGPQYWSGPDYAFAPGENAPTDWVERRADFDMARDEGLEFIKQQFLSRHTVEGQMLHTHVVSLTDMNETTKMYSEIEKMIIYDRLMPIESR